MLELNSNVWHVPAHPERNVDDSVYLSQVSVAVVGSVRESRGGMYVAFVAVFDRMRKYRIPDCSRTTQSFRMERCWRWILFGVRDCALHGAPVDVGPSVSARPGVGT